ncbi:MAG: hypothetical protein U0521_15765 [Anaerolineae bacterium]
MAAELGVVELVLVLAAIVSGVIAADRDRAWLRRRTVSASRLALFAVFAALLAVRHLDHYPWTQIHFQVAWWGCLAAFPRRKAQSI